MILFRSSSSAIGPSRHDDLWTIFAHIGMREMEWKAHGYLNCPTWLGEHEPRDVVIDACIVASEVRAESYVLSMQSWHNLLNGIMRWSESQSSTCSRTCVLSHLT